MRFRNLIYFTAFLKHILFGRGAVVAQLTVNQLVAGSNPAARANQASIFENRELEIKENCNVDEIGELTKEVSC